MLLEVKACHTAEVLVLTLLCVFIAKKKWNRNYIKLYSVDVETTIEFGVLKSTKEYKIIIINYN